MREIYISIHVDKRERGYKIQYCAYILCKYLPYKGGHIGILIDAAKDEGDNPEEQLHSRNYLASRLKAPLATAASGHTHFAWSPSMVGPKSNLLL